MISIHDRRDRELLRVGEIWEFILEPVPDRRCEPIEKHLPRCGMFQIRQLRNDSHLQCGWGGPDVTAYESYQSVVKASVSHEGPNDRHALWQAETWD